MTGPRPEERLEALREPVRRFAARIVRCPETAEDVAAEALLVVLERLRRGEDLRDLRAYALRVAWLKSRAARRRRRPLAWSATDAARLSHDPRRWRELRDWVLAAFERLDPDQRAILALRHEARLGHREIAAVLECPPGSVGGRLAAAEAALERGLRRVGRGEELPFAVALLPAALALDPLPAATPAAVAAGASLSLPTLLGGLAMKKLAGAALALLLIGGLSWWWLRTVAAPPPLPGIGAARFDGGPEPDVATSDAADGRGVLPPVESSAFSAAASPEDPVTRMVAAQDLRVVVRGVVLARDGRPVEGATVTLHRPGHAPARGRTDADGRYRHVFETSRFRTFRIGLYAFHPGHGAMTAGALVGLPRSEAVEMAPLVLAPCGRLEIALRRDGAPVAGRVSLEVPPLLRGADQEALLGSFATDARGRVALPPLPEAAVHVRALDAHDGTAERTLSVFAEEDRTEVLELAEGATLDVSVVDGRSARPVAGAALTVLEMLPRRDAPGDRHRWRAAPGDLACSDDAGRTRLHGLVPGSRVRLWARCARHVSSALRGETVVVAPGRNEVTVEVAGPRTVRFPLGPAEPPPPDEGTAIAIAPATDLPWSLVPPGSGVIEDGHLVVAAWPDALSGGLAVAPDGRVAPLLARPDEDRGDAIVFVDPVHLEVTVRDEDGTGLDGVLVAVQQVAGMPLAEALTDAAGEARLTPLARRAGQVVLRLPARRGPPVVIEAGSPDWEAEAPRLEVVVGRAVAVTLRFLCDGAPRLPADLSARIGGNAAPESWEERPDRGLARFFVRFPPGQDSVSVWIEGAGTAQVVHLRRPAPGDMLDEVIRWSLRPSLVVEVDFPEDGHVDPRLMTWSEGGGSWRDDDGHRPSPWERLGTRRRRCIYHGLPAGRYRVVDRHTGLLSDVVRVDDDGPPPRCALDLRDAEWAEGRVVGPDDADVSRALVMIAEAGSDPERWMRVQDAARLRARPFGVGRGGRFRVRLSGAVATRLDVSHPSLLPHPERGHLVARRFPGEVTLELHRGPTLRFDLVHPRPEGVRFDEGHVAAFTPGETGAPAWTARFPLKPVERQAVEVGAVRPGTWDLCLDLPGCAPLRLPGQPLEDAITDLGAVRPDAGVVLEITLVGDDLDGLRDLRAWARSGPGIVPALSRGSGVLAAPGPRVLVRGLVPGPWQLVVRLERRGRHETHEATIDVPSVALHPVRVTLPP